LPAVPKGSEYRARPAKSRPASIGAVTRIGSPEREISGAVTPIAANASVQALQAVATDVLIEADFATAEADTGEYRLSVPSDAARVAAYAASSPSFDRAMDS